MDKQKASMIGSEVRAAMELIAKNHGMEYQAQGGKYDPHGGTFMPKGEFREATINGEAREKVEFASNCFLFDLRPEQYLARIAHKGEAWEVYGFETRRSKFPIRIRNVATKKVMLTTEAHPEIRRLVSLNAPVVPRVVTNLLQEGVR